jgi:beta-glucanase (GH16 family)
MLGLTWSAQAQNYQLIWADEFDGLTINLNNWTHEIGTGTSGWGNNELQYYTTNSANSFVSNGTLKINAINQTLGQSNYTSARIITKDKFSFQYGKVEARIKMPQGQGLWPAFWMLGQNINSVGWPACGEIDIVEHVNANPDINGTMHWDNGGHVSWGGSTACDVSTFHDYAVVWDANGIHWLLDGNEYHSGDISNNVNGTEEFHQTFFLILNLAVGGNWPGSPNLSTAFPATMEVDYIRVYQIGQAQSNVTFQVDMSNVTTPFTTPEVNGTFNNWCGNCAQMTDNNGDNIFDVTIQLGNGNYEYKYSTDNWSGQEDLPVGSSCTTTNFGYTNRTLQLTHDTILPPVCYGSCTFCSQTLVPKNVTFQVDMQNVSSFTTPEVNGNFNNWCGNCAQMTDPDGDNIWTKTIQLLPGSYEYKFSYDNWTGQENLTQGLFCTNTTGQYTNRTISILTDTVLNPVCWESCTACPEIPIANFAFLSEGDCNFPWVISANVINPNSGLIVASLIWENGLNLDTLYTLSAVPLNGYIPTQYATGYVVHIAIADLNGTLLFSIEAPIELINGQYNDLSSGTPMPLFYYGCTNRSSPTLATALFT